MSRSRGIRSFSEPSASVLWGTDSCPSIVVTFAPSSSCQQQKFHVLYSLKLLFIIYNCYGPEVVGQPLVRYNPRATQVVLESLPHLLRQDTKEQKVDKALYGVSEALYVEQVCIRERKRKERSQQHT